MTTALAEQTAAQIQAKISTPSPDPKRGLVVKLCEIMQAVTYIQKRGTNGTQGYKYATEADVADMMRGEFASRNIFIFPNVVKNERVKVVRSKSYKDVIEEKVSYATDIEVDWTFVDGDTGQERTVRIPGCSESPGDKGVYVAMTGSEKYLLMKSFLIPTGDDPEDDSNETDGKGSKADAQSTGQAKIDELKKKHGWKTPDRTSTYVPMLFWSKTKHGYYIQGDKAITKANRDLLEPFWNEADNVLLVRTDDEFSVLADSLKHRNVPFQEMSE